MNEHYPTKPLTFTQDELQRCDELLDWGELSTQTVRELIRAHTEALFKINGLHSLVAAIYRDLPVKRDWFNPALERRIKAALAQAQPTGEANG